MGAVKKHGESSNPIGGFGGKIWGGIRGQGTFGIAIAVSVLIILVFVIYPASQIAVKAFDQENLKQWRNLSTGNGLNVIKNTVILGVSAGFVSTFAGLIMALVQVRTRIKGKGILHIISMIPVVSPPFAVAMSVITLFGKSGVISNDLLGVRYDIKGIDGLLMAISISFMPIAYLNFVGMLKSFDGALEEAATDLGGGLLYRFRTVVLPLLAPGIANSFLLVFVSAIADLGNPVVLAGSDFEVLSTRIFFAVNGGKLQEQAPAISVMLLAPSMLVYLFQYLWLRKKEYVTVTGKPVGDPHPIDQKSFSWPLCGLGIAIASFIVFMYGNIVYGSFIKSWGINNNLTFNLDNYREAFGGTTFEALTDTIMLALVATPLAALSGLIIAFVITQRKFRGRAILDFMSVLGIAIPGIIIGVGLLLAFNEPTLFGLVPKLRGTPLIFVMAFTIRSMPGVVRVAVGALNQISTNLEEASVSLGATRAQTFRKIVLPLIRPAVFSGLVWSFARSMTSLSPIILLVTPQWRIYTAEILGQVDQGRFSDGAARSVILIAVVLIAIGILSFATGFGNSDAKPSLSKRSS